MKRRAIIGQLTYKWTKSLRWVAEYGHIETFYGRYKGRRSRIRAPLGMMLFF